MASQSQGAPVGPDDMCPFFQTVEDIIKQNKENCLGLFQSQASIIAQIMFPASKIAQNESEQENAPPMPDAPPMPECMKVYLSKEDEDLGCTASRFYISLLYCIPLLHLAF